VKKPAPQTVKLPASPAPVKKAAVQPDARRKPVAPPAYRPQPLPKALQRKAAPSPPQATASPKHPPAAPPVYRPQAVPKLLQRKEAVLPRAGAAQPRRTPPAPPAYVPRREETAQLMPANATRPPETPTPASRTGHGAPRPGQRGGSGARNNPPSNTPPSPIPGARPGNRTARPLPAPAPFRGAVQRMPLPTELVSHIISFTNPDRAEHTNYSLVSKQFHEAAYDQGVRDELWYGENSLALNAQTQQEGAQHRGPLQASYQEGSCRPIAQAIVARLTPLEVSCMVGVLLGLKGCYYITLSGTKFGTEGQTKLAALKIACASVPGLTCYEVVELGKVARLDSMGHIPPNTVKNFNGTTVKSGFDDASTNDERINAPPGTCALPLLIEACRLAGDAPKFMSEVRYDPGGNSPVKVRIDPDTIIECDHNVPTPSCPNCRALTPAQLKGARKREREFFQGIKAKKLDAELKQKLAEEELEEKQRAQQTRREINRQRNEQAVVAQSQYDKVAFGILRDDGVFNKIRSDKKLKKKLAKASDEEIFGYLKMVTTITPHNASSFSFSDDIRTNLAKHLAEF